MFVTTGHNAVWISALAPHQTRLLLGLLCVLFCSRVHSHICYTSHSCLLGICGVIPLLLITSIFYVAMYFELAKRISVSLPI